MFLVSFCSCLCLIHWSQVLSWEWRCSWSSADRWCSNYIWVINKFIAYWGVSYIRDLTVHFLIQLIPIITLSNVTWLCIRHGNGNRSKLISKKDHLSRYNDSQYKDDKVLRPSILVLVIPLLRRWHLCVFETSFRLWTHERHPIACQSGQAMGCLLWVSQRWFTVIRWDCSIIRDVSVWLWWCLTC